MPEIIRTVSEWKSILKMEIKGHSLGFVPTMGALHDGHLSLVERSVSENDFTAVSIFVNPTQFNNPNDLKKYPRTFDKDFEMLNECKVDYIFYPDYNDIYNDQYRYKITESEFSTKLCGAFREGHFDGVLTVVMKLLNIIEADRAYFGEKDYQQYLLIDGMVKAFFMKTEIIACPTIRREDGLAHSSRNEMLTGEERKIAPIFPELLKSGLPPKEIREKLESEKFKVDYIEDIGNRRFGAVYLGKVRLIDNVELNRK